MGSISSFNCGVKYSLCAIDVFTKYSWVKSLMKQKAKPVLHDLIEILSKSKHNQNNLCVDQGRKLCNKLMQKWMNDNNVLMNLS